MHSNRLPSIILIYLLIAMTPGCAVRYGPRIPGFQPGFTEQQLGESTYQIRVGEAWPKDWPDLEKFAMYRAAEITESKSKRYFTVLNASSLTSTYYMSSHATSNTSATATRVGNTTYVNATTTTVPSTTGAISGGWYILDFRALADSEAVGQERLVDSQQVKRDLQFFINSRR